MRSISKENPSFFLELEKRTEQPLRTEQPARTPPTTAQEGRAREEEQEKVLQEEKIVLQEKKRKLFFIQLNLSRGSCGHMVWTRQTC